MKPLLLSVLCTAFAIVSCTSPKVGPTAIPAKVEGACPFECCTYGTWKAEERVTVYKHERDTSDVAFVLEAGTSFKALTGHVFINRPGKVIALDTFSISYDTTRWTVPAGDTLYLLNYEGEGYYRGWYKGERIPEVFAGLWYENKYRPDSTRKASLINEAETEWWAKIEDNRGRTGWISMEQAALSGVDACG